ncbi:hypothetical protein TNCV_5063751 [Trichonephila clavipes]|nr:hypothetical protein TNCV_5063751 [Trichonephila clavipes]
MITNFFIPELNNHDVQELWFQQDGATCHTARATIDLLKDTFGDRLISRFGPVNWPPRSCDLTPLDYFLWGCVKSLVYADKPQTLDHLEDNIRRVNADIRPQMLEKSSKIGRPDWTTSEPAVDMSTILTIIIVQLLDVMCLSLFFKGSEKIPGSRMSRQRNFSHTKPQERRGRPRATTEREDGVLARTAFPVLMRSCQRSDV